MRINKWRAMLSASLMCLIFFVVTGCGGGGSGKSKDSGSDNAVLQRWETVSKAVDEKIASLPRDKASRQLVAPEIYEFLKSRSEVENVGISAEKDAVWATVKGGGKIAFLNNRFPDETVSAPRVKNGLPVRKEFPKSSQAKTLEFFGSASNADEINSLMNNNGYQVSSVRYVEDLMNISGDGVFYFDTHGKVVDGKFILVTLTPHNAATEVSYFKSWIAGDVVNARVVIGQDVNKKDVYKDYFAITQSFVEKHIKFSENSVIFLNACEGDIDNNFKNQIFASGASLFVAWDKTVNTKFANDTAKKVFEYLIGDKSGVSAIDYLTVRDKLHSDGSDVDVLKQGDDPKYHFGAKINFTPNPTLGKGDFAQLAPSIDSATYDKTTQQITINGTFGSDPGSAGIVTLGTAKLSRVSWTATQLVYSAAGIAAGTYNVSVTVRDHKSNYYSVVIDDNFLPKQFRGNYLFLNEFDAKSIPSTQILKGKTYIKGINLVFDRKEKGRYGLRSGEFEYYSSIYMKTGYTSEFEKRTDKRIAIDCHMEVNGDEKQFALMNFEVPYTAEDTVTEIDGRKSVKVYKGMIRMAVSYKIEKRGEGVFLKCYSYTEDKDGFIKVSSELEGVK